MHSCTAFLEDILRRYSLRETHGVGFDIPFLPEDDYFAQRKKELAPVSYDEVWNTIHRGSMPELTENLD